MDQKSKNGDKNEPNKYQFSTQLEIEGRKLETVQEAKLLGTIVSNNLKWDGNTEFIVKKANKRMEFLRKVSTFGADLEYLKYIYIYYSLEAS